MFTTVIHKAYSHWALIWSMGIGHSDPAVV